ncbi:MAG: helix-turn-helix transcriptional regulator [Elusimicrobiota bacterium]
MATIRKSSFHSAAYRRFRRRLRDARVENKLTQRQVAKKLEKPPSYVAKIETGERRVDFIELQVLAALYKKPLSFFQD